MKVIRFNKDREKNVKAIKDVLTEHYNKYLNGKELAPEDWRDSYCKIKVGLKLLDDIVFGRTDDGREMKDWYLEQLNVFPDYAITVEDVYYKYSWQKCKNSVTFEFNRY